MRAPIPAGSCPPPGGSQGVGFLDFGAAHTAFDDLVKKPQHIGEVNPESAVQAPGVKPPVHQRVMAFDHHETLTFQTMHGWSVGG
jgi:hypothetical protein